MLGGRGSTHSAVAGTLRHAAIAVSSLVQTGTPRVALALMAVLIAAPVAAQTADVGYKARAEGGPGGGAFEQLCAKGEYLVGFAGREGAWIDQIQIICAVRVSAETVDRPTLRGAPAGGQGGSPFHVQCGGWSAQSGLRGGVGAIAMDFTIKSGATGFLNSIGWDCHRINAPGAKVDNHKYLVGIPAPDPDMKRYAVRQRCPAGHLGVGIHGRAGQSVDAVGLICGPALWQDSRPPPAPTAEELLRQRPGSDSLQRQIENSPGRLIPR